MAAETLTKRRQRVDLVFGEITEGDIPELTRAMTRAFDEDTRKYLGREKGGPPGYDDGKFFKKWLFSYDESRGHKVLADGRVVGGAIVWILPGGNNVLGTIFIDPDYQGKGVGTRAWQFIEKRYPETKSWKLGTPGYSVGNRYFYEHKCGFRKIKEEETDEHPGKTFTYRKEMKG